jgi:hypothetical protein
MIRSSALAMLAIAAPVALSAQAPSGVVAGFVSDATGAAVPGARVQVVNRDGGFGRNLTTSADGLYSAEALLPGDYRVSAEIDGFKRIERTAAVEAGATTTVDFTLELGDMNEQVTVAAATPLLRPDHHQVGGLVGRAQIDNLPLNGRNFLELAKLEPGVTSPVRLNDNRTFVPLLGSGLQTIPRVGYTRVTVDGGNTVTPGTAGVVFQMSQEVVQEFQISTVNFDQATSLSSNGAINVVTRAGGNDFRGAGFIFHRDHHLAAYPALRRDPANPNPEFRRDQFGFQLGGPIRTDRAFFLASYERNDQLGVLTVQPRAPEFAALGGIFRSPYLGDMVSARVDVRLDANHTLFARYTHDSNSLFSGGMNNALPSAWTTRSNDVNQALGALTSVLSARLVNDVRFSYFRFETRIDPARSRDCPGCFGLAGPRISIQDGVVIGPSDASLFGGDRFQLTDHIVWHKGRHRVRFGFDWEHAHNTAVNQPQPVVMTLLSPARARAASIPLPGTFDSVGAILQLPLRSATVRAGADAVPWRDFAGRRVLDLFRVNASDSWRFGRLTVNAGLAWSYEPNALNHDLTKPAWLAPILGADNLGAPVPRLGTWSPTAGFAWIATADGRTIVRGGAGRYFDPAASTNFNNLVYERLLLAPLGVGRIDQLYDDPLPTSFSGAEFLAGLTARQDQLLQARNPGNQGSALQNIDFVKAGQNLYDPSYAMPRAIHLGLGVQRELGSDLVVSADVVWKRFTHTFINGIDYNRWGSAGGPRLPACTGEPLQNLTAACSNGHLYFDTTSGRARYAGLLVRADKRFSTRLQFGVSYALASYVGSNGTGTGTSEASGGRVFGFNNDDWFENYGPMPTDFRHVLETSGFFELPWRLQLAFSVTANSRAPFSPYVLDMDFNGDGTRSDLLPGTTVNQFGRGLDEGDLERLVADYNQQYAGKPMPGVPSITAPTLRLPETYALDDNFFTQDVRLTHTVPLAHDVRLLVFGEVFNLLNTANLVQYGSNLADPATFGQPGSRSSQIFGSGGPRAFQLGARVMF